MTSPLDSLTDRAELELLLNQFSSGQTRRIDPVEMRTALSDEIRGQDHVIEDLTDFLHREWAKESRTRPIGSLLFLGPTGTGKSQLAKVLANHLYGDEKRMFTSTVRT